MDFFEVIQQRKSLRKYSEKEVEKQILEKIIDTGRLSATARNEQPWEFIVTSNKETLKKICNLCRNNGPFIKDASSLIAVFSKDTKYYIEDCSAATENMLLAIQSLELAGCWIAGDKKDYAEEIKRIFNVPAEYKLVSMITVGYPSKEKQLPPPKRSLKEVGHWEKW